MAIKLSNEFGFALLPVCGNEKHTHSKKTADGWQQVECKDNLGKQALLTDWRNVAARGSKQITSVFLQATHKTTKYGEFQTEKSERLNIGINLETSRLVVIDIDPRNGGSLEDVVAALGKLLPNTYTVITGSGGWHIFLQLPDGIGIPSCEPHQLKGVDLKGFGGYVIAEGSVHKCGQAYRHDQTTPRKIAVATPELIERIKVLWDVEKLANKQKNIVTVSAKANPLARKDKVAAQVVKARRDLCCDIPDGQRNTTLFQDLCSIRARGADDTEIARLANQYNEARCKPPLEQSEVDGIIEQVCRYERGELMKIEERCNDCRNAELFIDRHSDSLRYCREKSAWFIWNDKQWLSEANCSGKTVTTYAMEFAETFFGEAAQYSGADAIKLCRHANYSRSSKGIRGMLSLAQDVAGASVSINDFDADKDSLNVANGIIDLKTGELRKHTREEFHSKIAPVVYDPAAKAPRWEQFLDEVFAGDAELIRFFQRALGSALTGHTRDHCFFILYGSGRNGKGTVIRTMKAILGNYIATASTSVLLMNKDNGTAATPELAKLKGVRFAEASETDAGRKMAEALVKQITGGDDITCRFLNENPFTYSPEFKLFLSTNHKPEVTGTDDGMWSRIKLIPFTVNFEKKGTMDKALDDKLRQELPGILAWCVRGAVDWFQHGLGECEAVKKATSGYREESDPLKAFVAERCKIGQFSCETIEPTTVSVLKDAYLRWCADSGITPLKDKEFNFRLENEYSSKRKSRRIGRSVVKVWEGIRLIEDDDTENNQQAGEHSQETTSYQLVM